MVDETCVLSCRNDIRAENRVRVGNNILQIMSRRNQLTKKIIFAATALGYRFGTVVRVSHPSVGNGINLNTFYAEYRVSMQCNKSDRSNASSNDRVWP